MPESIETTSSRHNLRPRISWPGLAAGLIMVILATFLLHRALLPGYTLVPFDFIGKIAPWDYLSLGPRANRLIIDPFYSFFPKRHLFTEAIQSGQFLLWNPYMLLGTPSFANPNFQAFYPPNIVAALFLPTQHALPWLAWFHLIVTGCLMYLFLRRHQLHWLACVLGGGIWLLNGYAIVWLENPHRLSTAAWIPGIFWAFEVATQERKPAWAAIGGLFLGLSVLGGQVQFVFITGLILGLYALVKSILMWRPVEKPDSNLTDNENGRQVKLKDATRPFVYLVIIGVIGLGLGTLAMLPALEFSALSHRDLAEVGDILETRLPLQQLITLLAPDFYGNPASEVRYWGAVNYAEVTAYFGVVSLILALTAPLVARPRPILVYALVLMVAALAITLGTPLVRPLLLIPQTRFLALRRALFLIPLAGSWLAAAGLDGWLEARPSARRRFIALGSATLVIFIIAGLIIASLGDSFAEHRTDALKQVGRGAILIAATWVLLLATRRWARVAGLLIILLAMGDLLLWGRDFNPIISIEYRYPENEVVNLLRQDEGLFRVLPLQSDKLVFGPNLLSQFGLQDIIGYAPMIKKEYYQLVEFMDPDVEVGWMAANDNMLVMSHIHPLLSMLNVKYILAGHELPAEDIPLELHSTIEGVWIYENPKVAPRAYVVHHAQQIEKQQALSTLNQKDFDWLQSVILTTELSAEESGQLAIQRAPSQADVNVIHYSPQQVDLLVDTPTAGMLVLSDAYYPGWQATVDGEPVMVHEANNVMRAVFVPPGEHDVRFQFRPQILRISAFLATASLIFAIVVIWFGRKSYR